MSVKCAIFYHIGGSLSAREAGILRSAAALDGAVIDPTGTPLEGLFTHGRARMTLFSYRDGADSLPTVDAILARFKIEHVRHVVEMASEDRHLIGRRSMSYAYRTQHRGGKLAKPVELQGPADHRGNPLFTTSMAHSLSIRPDDLDLQIAGRSPMMLPHFEVACSDAEFEDLMQSPPLRYRDTAGQILRDRLAETVLIWSGEHRAYWREGGHGYTADPEKAGRWSRGDAEKEIRHCGPEKQMSLRTEAEAAEAAEVKESRPGPAAAGLSP